jgi:hypothetical protein
LFDIFSGSIGTTFFGKYIDVPLLKASKSIFESSATISATSAIATQRIILESLFSQNTASSKSLASLPSIVINGLSVRSALELLVSDLS